MADLLSAPDFEFIDATNVVGNPNEVIITYDVERDGKIVRRARVLRSETPIQATAIVDALRDGINIPLQTSVVVIPERKVAEGILIQSTSVIWGAIVEKLNHNWNLAYEIPSRTWEE